MTIVIVCSVGILLCLIYILYQLQKERAERRAIRNAAECEGYYPAGERERPSRPYEPAKRSEPDDKNNR